MHTHINESRLNTLVQNLEKYGIEASYSYTTGDHNHPNLLAVFIAKEGKIESSHAGGQLCYHFPRARYLHITSDMSGDQFQEVEDRLIKELA